MRLAGNSPDGLEQRLGSGIDQAWLRDQIPELRSAQRHEQGQDHYGDDQLTVIEVQQFRSTDHKGIDGYGAYVQAQLESLQLQPTQTLHFGRDPELPSQDTLDFSRLEAWHHSLSGCVWDPDSLSSFWFELVNGAYGDVYRAKALMNLPDGRSFFCNWMVSQQGAQLLLLSSTSAPNGRPSRTSELVVQGKALNPAGIQSTINDCLPTDEVLEMQQQQLRSQQPTTPQQA